MQTRCVFGRSEWRLPKPQITHRSRLVPCAKRWRRYTAWGACAGSAFRKDEFGIAAYAEPVFCEQTRAVQSCLWQSEAVFCRYLARTLG